MTRRLSKASHVFACDEDPAFVACGDWFGRQHEMERLFIIADLAAERLKAAGVTEFTEAALLASPDGLFFIGAWERADAFGRRNDAALRELPRIAATSQAGMKRKLEVVAAVIDARENKSAHALLLSAMADMDTQQQKVRPI